MLKVLVTCAVYMVCLFILVLVLCLMVWVIIRLLRWLFPQRFGPQGQTGEEAEEGQEDRRGRGR